MSPIEPYHLLAIHIFLWCLGLGDHPFNKGSVFIVKLNKTELFSLIPGKDFSSAALGLTSSPKYSFFRNLRGFLGGVALVQIFSGGGRILTTGGISRTVCDLE